MPKINKGESYKSWMSRCIPYLIDKEGKTQKAARGQCYGMWKNRRKTK